MKLVEKHYPHPEYGVLEILLLSYTFVHVHVYRLKIKVWFYCFNKNRCSEKLFIICLFRFNAFFLE